MDQAKTRLIPHMYVAVSAILLAIFMSVLDGTIMNIALPTLADQFKLTPSNSIWIVNAYQLIITMTLLPFASLGEIYGYRRLFVIGIAVFTLSSLACACSNSFTMLIIARITQGFGAAAIMSVNTALIRLIYPADMLGRGMGLNAMVVAISAVAGPSIAGGILAIATWHWLFVINVPIGIIAFIVGYKYLPNNGSAEAKLKFDKLGAFLNAMTFGLFIISLDGLCHSERHLLLFFEFLLFGIFLFLLIRQQLKVQNPILPIDLMRIPIFSLSIGTSIASFTAQMLALVSLPFFFQNVLHYSTVEIGLLLTPWPLGSMIAAPIAGRLVEKVHPGILGGVGMGFLAVGLLTLYMLPLDASIGSILWRMTICGIGFGLFQTPNNVTIVSSAPQARNGAASGALGAARLMGQTFGTTLAALFFHLFALAHGSKISLIVALGFSLIAGVTSTLRVTDKSPVK